MLFSALEKKTHIIILTVVGLSIALPQWDGGSYGYDFTL